MNNHVVMLHDSDLNDAFQISNQIDLKNDRGLTRHAQYSILFCNRPDTSPLIDFVLKSG
jgi:hypothetical protein